MIKLRGKASPWIWYVVGVAVLLCLAFAVAVFATSGAPAP